MEKIFRLTRTSMAGGRGIKGQSCKSTESLQLEVASGDHPVQLCRSGRVSQSKLFRAVSSWVSSVSTKGDHSLSRESVPMFDHPHSQLKCFLVFRGNIIHFSLCTLPLVLSLGITERSLAPSSSCPCLPCTEELTILANAEHWGLISSLTLQVCPSDLRTIPA